MALRFINFGLISGCAAQHYHGRGGPDVMKEFDMDNGVNSNYGFPFQPFPDAYVQKALSEGVDWTTDPRGIVTSVKNQGPHGYCGTFGRLATAEGQYAMRSGQPARNFSVEQLIDCVGWSNNQMPSILGQADAVTPGLMAWEDYEYDISKYPDSNPPIPDHPCKFDISKVVPDYGKDIIGQTTPSGQTEDQAAAFIHHNGPVSCGINANILYHADSDWFVTRDTCSGFSKTINHAVTCVGFGVDPVKGPYWKIKNSWGAGWGDHGFIRVARGMKCAGLGSGFGPMPVYHDISDYFENAAETSV